VIRQGMAADLVMLLGGLGFALAAGLGAGLLVLARPGTASRRGLDLATGVALSLPVYWMGFVILMLVASNTGLLVQLPFVSGAGQYEELPSDPLAFIRALWVPCIVVGLPTAAGVYRMTIASAREVLGEDFVRTARGKGLRERRVLLRHVLPVSGVPGLILAASQVNLLITNVCLMQSAFDIPGSFRHLVANTANADLAMLYGLIVWGCLLIAIANFAVDLLQSRLDPRVGAAMRRG
jgi:peptide/nickel transport system permease protein